MGMGVAAPGCRAAPVGRLVPVPSAVSPALAENQHCPHPGPPCSISLQGHLTPTPLCHSPQGQLAPSPGCHRPQGHPTPSPQCHIPQEQLTPQCHSPQGCVPRGTVASWGRPQLWDGSMPQFPHLHKEQTAPPLINFSIKIYIKRYISIKNNRWGPARVSKPLQRRWHHHSQRQEQPRGLVLLTRSGMGGDFSPQKEGNELVLAQAAAGLSPMAHRG